MDDFPKLVNNVKMYNALAVLKYIHGEITNQIIYVPMELRLYEWGNEIEVIVKIELFSDDSCSGIYNFNNEYCQGFRVENIKKLSTTFRYSIPDVEEQTILRTQFESLNDGNMLK